MLAITCSVLGHNLNLYLLIWEHIYLFCDFVLIDCRPKQMYSLVKSFNVIQVCCETKVPKLLMLCQDGHNLHNVQLNGPTVNIRIYFSLNVGPYVSAITSCDWNKNYAPFNEHRKFLNFTHGSLFCHTHYQSPQSLRNQGGALQYISKIICFLYFEMSWNIL